MKAYDGRCRADPWQRPTSLIKRKTLVCNCVRRTAGMLPGRVDKEVSFKFGACRVRYPDSWEGVR